MIFDCNYFQNCTFSGIDMQDFPLFSNAVVLTARYKGVPLEEVELADLNKDKMMVHRLVLEHLEREALNVKEV